MPRIDAPTLAEHRDQRRAELLNAGCEILAQEGPTAVTMAAVAQRTGLSRPGVYEYFTSTEDLLTEVLCEHLRVWSSTIAGELQQESDPTACLQRYVEGTLDMRARGIPVSAPGEGAVPPGVAGRLRVHLTPVTEPLILALTNLGVRDPERALRMVQAIVDAAARRIAPGADPADEISAASAFILAGVSSLDSAGRAHDPVHREQGM